MSLPSKPLQRLARRLFFRSMRRISGGYLEIVCPEETYAFGDARSTLRAMAVIHDQRFFLRAVTGSDTGIGESFMDGDWTSPDLVALVRLAVRNLRLLDAAHPLAAGVRGWLSRLRHALRGNSLVGSRRNIRHHYDLGNSFYQLFLDERMQYSSALFLQPQDSLEVAQRQKLDLICRKLQLCPGDRVLEIGCGWGGFARYAAQNFGAHVTGLTLSAAQHSFATEQAGRSPLGNGSVRFLLEDYRRISGRFDKIVSIEMFEAVGFARYDEFFAACDRRLAPDGLMLLQTITLIEQEVAAYRRRVDWMQTHIFPGSELASIAEVHASLGRVTQLFPVHVENLGLHYAQTVACWRERFLRNLPAVRALGFGPRFERMWDFYLAWCEGGFRERYINVVQLLLAKNGTQRELPGDPPRHRAPLARRASA